MAPWISILHEDSQGNIWAASSRAPWGTYLESGIYMYDGSGWKQWTMDDGLASNIVHSFVEDENGIIWAGTNGGLCYYDGYQWKSWEWLPSIYGAEVFDIIDDGNGSIWVSTYAGVSRFDGFTWTKMLDYPGIGFAGETPGGPFALDTSGNVWVGLGHYIGGGMGIGGMSRYDGENWTVWTRKTPDFYLTGFVRGLLLDSSGNMWVGTEMAGAIMLDGERWSDWLEDEFLNNRKVYALLEDDHGNIWASSDDSIRCFDGTTWTLYTAEDGLYPGPVKSLVKDDSGQIWALSHAITGNSYNGGLSVYDGQKWTKINSLVDRYTKCMTIDENGSIRVGPLNSVSKYDGVDWKSWENGLDYGIGYVTSILSDDFDKIWLGLRPVIDENRMSHGGGVALFDGMQWKTWTTADGLPSNTINCLYADNNGNVWIGMKNGVSRLSGFRSAISQEVEPDNFSINGFYPNPFNVRCTIAFSLSGEGFTELVIYNSMGQKIKKLVAQYFPAGNHSKAWDGTNAMGKSVSSGIYFAQLKQGDRHKSGKILLLK